MSNYVDEEHWPNNWILQWTKQLDCASYSFRLMLESIFPNRFLLIDSCTSLCRESLPKRDWKCLYWMKQIVCIETTNVVYRDVFGTFKRSFLMTQVGMSFFFSFNLHFNIYFLFGYELVVATCNYSNSCVNKE